MSQTNKNVLNFLHATEQLKNELRHSWTSQGRQESVAEHSWRVALMLIICAPYLDKKIDLLKALKLAIFHDLGEAKIGDEHYLNLVNNEGMKKVRYQLEKKAVDELSHLLGSEGSSIANLWKEFEDRNSEEAKIVYFLDKLEACVQHNEADISSWTEREIATIEEYFYHLKIDDDFLLSLKEVIKSETFNKVKI